MAAVTFLSKTYPGHRWLCDSQALLVQDAA